ncbi:MAG: hypothetical protein CXX80_03405 [Methanobacteriota archaeon]|nr:MAG: hypothetical protein CXX80_12665 [Euryarchaeota archaeon]PXY72577.1 MAG: hypothetical protein CXX80_09495 [Euryarchaeota archaeon]PXY76163.1 MAG: hypothetical protein CXX80_03405 [Euryarchaeota archaeon]
MEAGLMTSVVFRGLFDTTIPAFFFPGTYGTGVGYIAQTAEGMTGAYLSGNAISLSEFFGVGSQTTQNPPVMDQLKENFTANGLKMCINLLVIPLAFRVGKQVGRPAINQINRLIDNVGLKAVKL